jgi:hypothetical protein
MAMSEEDTEEVGEKGPRILRGRVDSFALYEITDAELDTLESGSPSSTHLNFAIFLLSVAVSFFIALTTSTMSDRVYTLFLVFTVIGAIGGAYSFVLWHRARESVKLVVKRIRARIPGDRIVPSSEQSEQLPK